MPENVTFTLQIPKGAVRAHRGSYGGCKVNVGRLEIVRGDLHFSHWYSADKDVSNAVALDFYPVKGQKPVRIFTEDTPEGRQGLISVLKQAIQQLEGMG